MMLKNDKVPVDVGKYMLGNLGRVATESGK